MASSPTPQFPLPAVSASDILTTLKNVATAINGLATTELNIAGSQSACGITSATLVKIGAGRIVTVSVIVGGSTNGKIYDAATVSDTSKPLCVIPYTAGASGDTPEFANVVNLPCAFGLLVVPGTGQTVTVGYS